jgi:uncharacterized protein (DUF4415 family)
MSRQGPSGLPQIGGGVGITFWGHQVSNGERRRGLELPVPGQQRRNNRVPQSVIDDWAQQVVIAPRDKVSVGIRLDRDLVDWFKAQGPGYQTRINAVLRQYVEAQQAAR